MRIGRKEAILALIASVIPFVGRKARAQVISRTPLRDPTLQTLAPTTQDLADLQRRVTALETLLANQVAFTKDAYGNLRLRGNTGVYIEAGTNLTLRASSQADVASGGPMTIRGTSIALN